MTSRSKGGKDKEREEAKRELQKLYGRPASYHDDEGLFEVQPGLWLYVPRRDRVRGVKELDPDDPYGVSDE